MTTVLAYRDTIYADSAYVDIDTGQIETGEKIFRIGIGSNTQLWAFAGDLRLRHVFGEHLRKGFKLAYPSPVLGDDEDFSAIVLRADGLFTFDNTFSGIQIHGIYAAIGSGAQAVLGAVRYAKRFPAPLNPIRAMEAALEGNAYSAGPIQWRSLTDPLLQFVSVY